MAIRFFSIRANAGDTGQQDELNAFIYGHRIVSMQKELVADGAN